MRAATLALLALLGTLPAAVRADDELTRLRSENAQLKAQIEDLQKSCPAAAARHAAVSAAQPPAAAPAPGPMAATAEATTAPPVPTVPPGYQLVKIEPKEAYADTGCTYGLTQRMPGPDDLPWKLQDNWNALRQGMTPKEVEKLLGVEHHEVRSGSRIGWQYGTCGKTYKGLVVFDQGHVLFWQKPDF